ncbi:MAG: hypothetical protein JJD96_09990 [Thermoleophilia bacterium]|nr:hypothetical protein [Thermoleophilia bacterium]
MEDQREPIDVIKIGEKDFEESDVAIINVFSPSRRILMDINRSSYKT